MVKMLDFSKIKTISIKQRKNKVKLSDLIKPENSEVLVNSQEFDELIEKMINVYKNKNQIILMILIISIVLIIPCPLPLIRMVL